VPLPRIAMSPEVVDLLAELAPEPRQALRIAARKAYVVVDGALDH
jgi:hypothetical protein